MVDNEKLLTSWVGTWQAPLPCPVCVGQTVPVRLRSGRADDGMPQTGCDVESFLRGLLFGLSCFEGNEELGAGLGALAFLVGAGLAHCPRHQGDILSNADRVDLEKRAATFVEQFKAAVQ